MSSSLKASSLSCPARSSDSQACVRRKNNIHNNNKKSTIKIYLQYAYHTGKTTHQVQICTPDQSKMINTYPIYVTQCLVLWWCVHFLMVSTQLACQNKQLDFQVTFFNKPRSYREENYEDEISRQNNTASVQRIHNLQ